MDEKILFILIPELCGTTLNFAVVENALITSPYPGPAIYSSKFSIYLICHRELILLSPKSHTFDHTFKNMFITSQNDYLSNFLQKEKNFSYF